MSRGLTSGGHDRAFRVGYSLLLVALLAGCGSSSEPDRRGPAASEPGGTGPGAAGSPALGAPAGNGFLPPKALAVVEKPAPAVAECIEKRIHSKAYDALSPRDARRKLRRLQLQAECEEQLAAR
jgi:hypothetical protein